MTRPLALPQRQVRALCAGAKKEGFVPVVKIDGTVILLVPEDKALEQLAAGKRLDEKVPIPL